MWLGMFAEEFQLLINGSIKFFELLLLSEFHQNLNR